MNYMTKVAKMFDVELGEKFKCSNGYEYKFTKNGLLLASDIANKEGHYDQIFMGLLTGSIKIEYKPYKPKNGDKYWTVTRYGDSRMHKWENDLIDVYCYKLGNCYKTKDEADSNLCKWIEFYLSDDVLEV